MRRRLQRLQRELLRLAGRAAAEGWTVSRLEREIDRAIAAAGLGSAGDGAAEAAQTAAALGDDAAARFTRLRSLTASSTAQADAARVVETIGRDVTRLQGRLRSSLMRDLADVLRRGGSVADAEAVVRRRTRQAEHAVQAVASTAVAQFDRAIGMASDPEGQRYRYTGPPADRDFCRARLREAAEGVTYTREEMAGLSNGQGLDVALACGGWSCRHRWVAVRPSASPSTPPLPVEPPAPPVAAYSDAAWATDLATIDTPALRASRDRHEFQQRLGSKRVRLKRRTATSGLTAEEAFPVFLYTRPDGLQPHHYRAVNRRLYEAHRDAKPPADTPPLPDGWTAAYERATNAALRRLPTHEGEVWRKIDRAGLDAADRVLFDAAHVPGGIVEYGAFTSTSTSRSVAEGFFGDTMMRIQSKTGRSVQTVSSLGDEKEVLFPTRTRFRVVSVSSSGGRTQITLEEL